MKEINESDLSQQLELYENIFDIVQVVDPIQKKIIKFKKNETISDNTPCYSLWLDHEECKDCIGIKALHHQKTLTKILHDADKILFMIAAPLKVNGNTFVLELIIDITDNFVFETVVPGKGHELRNILQELYPLILKDALTNLYNRRYIDQMLPKEIINCTNNKYPLSIAMIDIDHFKIINDTYGHNVGDIVIKEFSQILSGSIRNDVDWAARYGGEEFLVCFPNTDNKKAYKVLERIRKAVERTNIEINGKKIQMTGSFGLCTVKGDELTAADLIKCADDKLYQAKNQGRNRVVS